MRKQRFKTLNLFLKLMLLFQIYSHHQFEAEATENAKNCDECEGTGLNNPISKNETLNSVFDRPKRPARLLPLRMILGKEKNKTESENATNHRFYGPASSCEELLKIGFTRNGFYLVKGNATSNNNRSNVEIVDCLFKHPNRVKEVKEKRLGIVPMKIKEISKFHQRRTVQTLFDFRVESASEIDLERSKRPARILPYHLLYGNEKNETEGENVSKPFYGPASNCVELAKLGYTLNGYYLVNGSKIISTIEVILCLFQLPPGVNETAMEERLGFINLDQLQSSSKEFLAALGRKIRPVRLLPPRRQIEKGENKTAAEQNVQRLNSNPSNCNDIGILGYTLNGYYLVKSSERVGQLGVFFCKFKLPPGANRFTSEEIFGFVNLLDKITNETSNEAKKQPKNCKNQVVLIKDEEFGSTCIESRNYWDIVLRACERSKSQQHWVIWKTENDPNNIRICQREGRGSDLYCLTPAYQIDHHRYKLFISREPTIKPNNQARDIRLKPFLKSDPSQQWKMNSTTHQLASVEYPKACITTKHFDDHPDLFLLLECDGYGHESPNPQLNKHQRFYPEPALDKNKEELCEN